MLRLAGVQKSVAVKAVFLHQRASAYVPCKWPTHAGRRRQGGGRSPRLATIVRERTMAARRNSADDGLAALSVTLDDVEAAQKRLRGAIVETDCDFSRTLSEILGCRVWLKFENLQFTASFKERGALNRLSALSAEERSRGVIAMSAGNHAQGVAYHASR